MSILSALTKWKTFDSHSEIVELITGLEQENVYLRRDRTETIASYNKNPKNKHKLDLNLEYKRVQYICPHFGCYKSRATKGLRLNQNVMAHGCPVHIQFAYDVDELKFKITSLNLEHQNHPISEEHVKTYVRKKHMPPEALTFAKDSLSSGAQPTKVRMILQEKFSTHLISKDLINIKQSLTGKSEDEWKDTVKFLEVLHKDENNIVNVLHDPNGEVAAIFVQMERQRKLYEKYGKLFQLDGTYRTTQAGFTLYHLLIEDNNGSGQPVALFFLKEEKAEAISACLKIFAENNDVSVTKVTITDKDCAEISALQQHFTDAKHILCQFYVLKAVDSYLKKTKNGECLQKIRKLEMLKKFRLTMYAETQAVFDENRAYLIDKSHGIIASYFEDNWFNISEKWTNLGRHDLCTLGNNTTNRLERFHHIIKEVFQKSRRFDKVLTGLIDIVLIRLSDRQLKQRIQELRFAVQEKNPAVSKFADSISPFAWNLLNKEMKIMQKNYDFVHDQDSSTYHISSRNTTYKLKVD